MLDSSPFFGLNHVERIWDELSGPGYKSDLRNVW